MFMSKFFSFIALIVTFCGVFGSFSTASAAQADIAQAQGSRLVDQAKQARSFSEFYRGLSRDQQKVYTDFAKPDKTIQERVSAEKVTPAQVRTANPQDVSTLNYINQGCWRLTSRSVITNSRGNWLAAYYLQSYACYDGSKITYTSSPQQWPEIYVPGWGFYGNINSYQDGTGRYTYSAFGQGQFKLCISFNIGCVSESLPWVRNTHYGNGTYYISAG
jgi:hypothetical protein